MPKHDLVVVAGTFDVFHAGHKKLLEAAFKSGRRVEIGVSSDVFAKRKYPAVQSFEKRVSAVRAFLQRKKYSGCVIFQLNDAYGSSLTKDYCAIVVSEETLVAAEKINEIRVSHRRYPLEIIVVPLALAKDLKPVSSSRIRAGEIDSSGRRLKKLVFAVGSANPLKIRSVKQAALPVFGKKISVIGTMVNARVPDQPFGNQTIRGAIQRAKLAFKKTKSDYGIGLESGLFKVAGRHIDVLWCAVYDGKEILLGHSMGFEIPEYLVKTLREKDVDLSESFRICTGISGVGKKGGVLKHLSKGFLDRSHMVEQAFTCAFVPKLAIS